MALALDTHSGSWAQATENTLQSANKMDQAMESRQPDNHKSWTATKSRKKKQQEA